MSEKEYGALIQESDRDYILEDGHESVWITVGNLSVYIKRTDEGVVVDIFPKDQETDESLASTYAFFNEGGDG